MTTYFVTRHAGALEWARGRGLNAIHIENLDPAVLVAGDWVLGTLPVSVAAEVCARGARYFHLTLSTPPELRGRELTSSDMEAFGADLQEFEVKQVE